MAKDRVDSGWKGKLTHEPVADGDIGSTIEERQHIDLSASDARVFVEALTAPSPVNDRLRDTVQRYRQATGE